MTDPRRSKSRIVVETQRRHQRPTGRVHTPPRNTEVWAAIIVIAAAAVATFGALFITSRPYDPMSATLQPEQTVPAGASFTPTPKATVSATPTPLNQLPASTPQPVGGETSAASPPDDATIQANIERALAADPTLSGLDVSTLVENGKVTIVGSVRSAESKQRVERTIRNIKGVLGVDNQLVIAEATPGGLDFSL